MRIAVLTPSRGRPARFTEMVESIRATSHDVAIFAGLDDDDAGIYPRLAGVEYFIGGRRQLGPWTNWLAEETWDEFDILASFGDDHRCRTEGWDDRVRGAFDRMGSGLVYTRDGLQDVNLPTAPLWSADVIRSLGWYFPPAQAHLYADNFWLRLGQDTRISYLPDVLIEHMHPAAGKAEMDPSYAISNSGEMDQKDHAAYDTYLADGYLADLERVKKECGI